MFEVNGTRILLTRGDSALLTIEAESDHVFTEADKAVFTIRRPSGSALVEMVLQPEPNGTVQIALTNDMTDGWREGDYEWDIRYVTDAVVQDERVVDGREVVTPMRPGRLMIEKAVGRV